MGHAARGGNETIIFLVRAGEPATRLKLEKPVETVTQAEIADVFASLVTKKEFL